MAGKSNKGAQRLLDLRGQKWWFKIDVPKSCRPFFDGRTAYLVNLQTSDVRIAKERRDEIELECRARFKDIRSGKVIEPAILTARERGSMWRQTLTDLIRDPGAQDTASGDFSLYDIAQDLAQEEAEKLRDKERKQFEDAFVGKVPVDEHLEAYLVAIRLAPKTTGERRGLVKRFARWCEQDGLKLTEIDRRVVGRYVAATIEPMDRSTAKKHMTAMRGYWDYLTMRGHVHGKVVNGKAVDSPWLGQEITNNRRRVERGDRDKERPFTTDELRTLLYGKYPEGMEPVHRQQIVDALRISLLSGMRMAEVLTLWVEEVQDGVFDIQQGKTQAAARKVHIHPELKEIIKRRTAGKGQRAWLFHELTDERDPGDTFGKRFNRYRKHLGVDDVRQGKRRSFVNFHSARRWFITEARHASQPVETIKDVVGHVPDKKADITFAVYTPGASDRQMRQCVEAVKLPKDQLHATAIGAESRSQDSDAVKSQE